MRARSPWLRPTRRSLLIPLLLALLSCGSRERGGVLLVGVDGASWKVIGRLLVRGELPAFRRLTIEGAYTPRFETLESTDSPVVWTSVATGRRPAAHGIRSYTQRLPDGRLVPITSHARRVKAIWNVATEAGLSVGVIGWWASWPAEQVNGYIVTDHANPASSGWMLDDGRYWTADPDRLRELGRDFEPLDLAASLKDEWLDKDAFPAAEFQRRSQLSDEQMAVLNRAPWFKRNAYSWLKTFYAVDYPHFKLSMRLARERATDLQMLYLRGPDPVQHYAWDLVEPEKYALQRATLERDRGIVEGVYRFVDSFLGEILEAKDPSTTLIVASDHGAEPAPGSTGPEPAGRPGAHSVAAKGVLFLHGPHVKTGHRISHADPLDLMPTIAWLLELPIADELDGSILTEAFDEDFVRDKPVSRVASYGERETQPAIASPSDEALLEQLRALGYVD